MAEHTRVSSSCQRTGQSPAQLQDRYGSRSAARDENAQFGLGLQHLREEVEGA